MLQSKSFHDSLVATMCRGGDTDTNGCITGALLGAKFRAEGVPKKWKETVTKARSSRIKANPFVDLSDLETAAVDLLGCLEPDL